MKNQTKPQSLRRLLMAAALLTSAAHAQIWTGATSGNWTDSNWSSAPAFNTSTDLTFSQAGAGNLSNFTGAATTVRSLSFTDNQSVTIRTTTTADGNTAANLTFDGGGGGASLNVTAGTTADHIVSTAGGSIVLADNLTVNHQGSGNVTINRSISGVGFGITKNGTGTLALATANPFTGGLVINEGVIRAAGGCATVTDVGAGTVTLGGGTLEFVNTNWSANKNYNNAAVNFVTTAATSSTMEYVNTSGTARNLTLGGGATTLNGDLLIKNLNATGANAFAYSQPISGAGKLSYESSTDIFTNIAERRLQFGGNNTGWSGELEIRKGSVYPTAANTLGTAKVMVGVTGSSDNAALYHAPGPATTVNFANDITITTGNGTRMLQGAGNASTSVTWSGNITLNGNLTYSAGVILSNTISGNLTGAGGLAKIGNGTLTLSGTNTYLGNTTVSAGALSVSGGNALSNSNILRITSPGVVNLSSNETVGQLFIADLQQAAGNYTSSSHPASFTGSGILTVLNGAGSGYTSWALTNAGGQAANLDFDGDGIDNGAEFFMGTAGNAFTANPQPVAGVITWPVAAGTTGASAIVQVSNNLSTWTNAAVTYPGSVNTSNPAQIQFTVPTGQGKLFYRLTVTVTP